MAVLTKRDKEELAFWVGYTEKDTLYWMRVKKEALRLKSDGCTGVPDWFRRACLEHDVHYRTHRRINGNISLCKEEADYIFKVRMQHLSWFGRFSPMAWWRWMAVKTFGRKAWNKGGFPGT